MLERASTCLESSGRQLLHASKPCLRSRRMLHSHFWHHGASDLSLPIWWATPSVFETCGDTEQPARASLTPARPLLDFLYPEKTLALINRLSAYVPDGPTPKTPSLSRTRVRQYSTVTAPAVQDEATASAEDQAKAEMKILLHRSTAVAELGKILGFRRSGRQELAWQMYNIISEEQHADTRHRLRKDMLEYLVQDEDSVVAGRVLHIFGELSESARRASSYRAAVIAYIHLRMIGPAIKLLEDVDEARGFDMARLGIDAILRRTVADEQWELALRVFRMFLRHTPSIDGKDIRLAIRHGDMDTGLFLSELWQGTRTLSQLKEHLQSFFFYVQEYRKEIQSSPQREYALSCFVMTFVPQVMSSVLEVSRPSERFIQEWFLQLFKRLKELDLPTSACYEAAIRQMVRLPRYQQYTNRRKIWLELYEQYKQNYLDVDQTIEAKPSENIIRKLMVHAGLHASLQRMKDKVEDLRKFYPDRPLRPGLLKYLLIYHADRGAEDLVIEFFDEMSSNYKDDIDLKVLSSLLHVHARRGDCDQAAAVFQRISGDFDLIPDTTCWNILLNAYCRADDLDGALEVFNQCLDAGLTPDVQTFGPMLDFCSHRGDIEAFEALFSRGKRIGVPLDTDVRARSGYVEVSLNAEDIEGASAIAQGMLRSWKAGTLRDHQLTHTWNLLIQHYAVNGELGASRECYAQMRANSIPLDSWTYAGLMRALIQVKETNAAYKILRVTMPNRKMRAHALHYAICMSGFLREGQLHKAEEVYERMTARNVPQTGNSQQASIQTLGMGDLKKLKHQGAKDPQYRMLRVQAALEDMLITNTSTAVASREPLGQRYLDTKDPRAVPQQQFGLLASLYSKRSAFGIIRKLLKKAEEAAPDSDNYHTPLTLLNTTMEVSLLQRHFDSIEQAWNMARATGDHLTKTFHSAAYPSDPTPVTDPSSDPDAPPPSLLEPTVRESFEKAYISSNRRHILARSARLYLRSLYLLNTPAALSKAQSTIHSLLTHGYSLDNLTWNEFVQNLCTHNRLIDAFGIAEHFLMPRFPGWRNLFPTYIRHNAPGFQWMEITKPQARKTGIVPRFKTLVMLTRKMGEVRMQERNGQGWDKDREMWLREVLEREAPMACRAIESMPKVMD